MTPIIQTEGLTKEYGSVVAVDSVDMSIDKGEVHALVGDNGAGKSTLIRMLSGVTNPTSGSIYVNDRIVDFSNHNEARNEGIETVYQELALAEKQTVSANVFLGREPYREGVISSLLKLTDHQYMNTESRRYLERMDMDMDPTARANEFSGGQQQAIAIARALQTDPEILIMDEPTSALSIEGSRKVREVIQSLRNDGLTILLISHNIMEVLEVADRISVLFNGELRATQSAEEMNQEEVVSVMVGAEPSQIQSAPN